MPTKPFVLTVPDNGVNVMPTKLIARSLGKALRPSVTRLVESLVPEAAWLLLPVLECGWLCRRSR